MKTKCSSCNGVYDSIQADGTAYYHACAPLRRLRVQELDGTFSTVAPGTEGARPVVAERLVDRPNRRDERIVRDPSTGIATLVAVGTGVTQVPDNSVP